MRLFALIACSASLLVFLASCATTAATTATGPAPSAAPAEPVWLVQKSLRSYPDGFPSSSQIFDYDSQGRLVKESEFNSSAILIVQRSYQYKAGGIVEIATLDPEGNLMAKTIQEYKNGLLMRERVLNPSDEVHFTSDFRYDAKGHKVYWGISGRNTATTTSEYVYSGDRLKSIIVTGPLQNLLKRYERSYSEAGILQREDEIDSKGQVLRQTFYDWQDARVQREETKDSKGSSISAIAYNYDQAGRLIKLEIFGQGNSLLEIQTQEWVKIGAAGQGK